MQRSPSATFLQQVRRTITRYRMLGRGDRVLVAVSGGPDSVALLAALAQLAPACGIDLCAAHLNHHLRGAESRRDQEWAEAVSQRLGVACVVGSATLTAGPNLEARARDERYRFLEQAAAAEACTKIATGHTLDDQAETVMMRLLRGTGWDGLAGIHAVRDSRIIRPLIECTRAQILQFLDACGLPFCEDSSNRDARFLRNRVRHEALPLLESISPDVKRRLASVAQIATEEIGWLNDHVRSMLGPQLPDGALAVSAVIDAPPQLRARLVRTWLRQRRGDLRRLSAAHVRAVMRLAEGSRPNGSIRLPGGQRVVREYQRLVWRPVEKASVVEPARILTPGTAVRLASGWRISASVVTQEEARQRPADLWALMADAEALAAPLVVRGPRPGDRVRPLGLGGQRKLQDIFVDRKLPRGDRRACPVVECNGEILWVPGLVRSGAALVTAATRTALRLAAEKSIAAT